MRQSTNIIESGMEWELKSRMMKSILQVEERIPGLNRSMRSQGNVIRASDGIHWGISMKSVTCKIKTKKNN